MTVPCWTAFGVFVVLTIGTVVNHRRTAERKRIEQEHHRRAAFERALVDLALTCRRCHALAPPIPGTGNRYKCEQCSNQFAAARHNL